MVTFDAKFLSEVVRMALKVQRYFLPESFQNYNHLVWSAEHKTAAVIDPFDWAAAEHEAQQLGVHLQEIWLTHGHGDHIRGVPANFSGRIIGHVDLASQLNITQPVDQATSFEFAGERIEVLLTPGHIPDHICFFLPNVPALIAGDTLFNAGVGNTRSGDTPTLYRSIQRLKKLPAETQVYNGHDYFLTNLKFTESVVGSTEITRHWISQCEKATPDTRPITTIGDELQYNLFLNTEREEIIKSLDKQGFKTDSSESTFAALRNLRDQW
ncbi:hydroxyacylglutathione hydrolase [Salinispirillum marinum]